MIQLSELITLLNENYLKRFNTVLLGGFNEPFYQAAQANNPAEIQFSHDYIRSALHELAHWCVAGVQRRQQDDYGYWYAQDGRNQEQQDEFFQLEIKPQAIEWAFSIISGVKFEVSVDNLNKQVEGAIDFQTNVKKQLQQYIKNGFSKRTDEIIQLLSKYKHIKNPLCYLKYSLVPDSHVC